MLQKMKSLGFEPTAFKPKTFRSIFEILEGCEQV